MLGDRPRNPLNLSHGVFVPFLLMFICCVGYPGPSLIAGPGRPRALVQSSVSKWEKSKVRHTHKRMQCARVRRQTCSRHADEADHIYVRMHVEHGNAYICHLRPTSLFLFQLSFLPALLLRNSSPFAHRIVMSLESVFTDVLANGFVIEHLKRGIC